MNNVVTSISLMCDYYLNCADMNISHILITGSARRKGKTDFEMSVQSWSRKVFKSLMRGKKKFDFVEHCNQYSLFTLCQSVCVSAPVVKCQGSYFSYLYSLQRRFVIITSMQFLINRLKLINDNNQVNFYDYTKHNPD